MINIDKELIDWAVNKIKKEYPDDVALLIGQVGACKTPEDEQNMAFDFYVPATDRGYGLAKTFIIEDMGYDLYPMCFERLEGIADFNEPRMIFAVMKGEVIYARTPEDRKRYEDLKETLRANLCDTSKTFTKALEFLNTAMEIYQTMMFENSLCAVRKAAGGISCYLMNSIAMVNGQYLKNGYGNLTIEIKSLKAVPDKFEALYGQIFTADSIEKLQNICHELIAITRDFFIGKKPSDKEETGEINYDDLADWYQEARYTFRRIQYFAENNKCEDCFLLGCYIQIEFDAIQEEFNLKTMDLLGAYDSKKLMEFADRANMLENYILDVLKAHNAKVKIYDNLEAFLKEE